MKNISQTGGVLAALILLFTLKPNINLSKLGSTSAGGKRIGNRHSNFEENFKLNGINLSIN